MTADTWKIKEILPNVDMLSHFSYICGKIPN
jgi:hypothetical protein